MKSKLQKTEELNEGKGALKESEAVIITNFKGLSSNDMTGFRKAIKAIGGSILVTKKRLFKLLFKEHGLEVPENAFEGQVNVVFSPKDLVETSSVVYKFAKTRKDTLKILGGLYVKGKSFISGKEVETIGNLPSKEVLLGQLVGMIASPIRSFLFVLNEKARKSS